MKKINLAAVAAAALLALTMSACEVPEDGETAADRSSVNKKGKDDKKEADSGPKETASQESARRSAENYLDTAPFSRKGLIDQLKFEDYSVKDATYGVDAQKADWNKQAAAAAETYLDMMGYSRQGLIDQLKFEGYTQAQAEYGVKAVGL